VEQGFVCAGWLRAEYHVFTPVVARMFAGMITQSRDGAKEIVRYCVAGMEQQFYNMEAVLNMDALDRQYGQD
jgi:hypothetical protein